MVVKKGRFVGSKETQEIVSILNEIQRLNMDKKFSYFLKAIMWFASGCQIKEYKEEIDSLSKEEGEVLGKAFAKFVEMQNANPLHDYLGEIYENYVTFGENGQFFTPNHITEFIATLVLDTENNMSKNKSVHEIFRGQDIDKQNMKENNEVRKIYDPACGSGKMLLGFARKHISNPLDIDKYLFIGQDLDERCFLMTSINLWINGLNGIVIHGNSITGETFKTVSISGGKIKILK